MTKRVHVSADRTEPKQEPEKAPAKETETIAETPPAESPKHPVGYCMGCKRFHEAE